MRAGPDTALARVVTVFGTARPHCAYLFANRRGNRMKVLVHDGLGIWLCARRLNQGKFHWAGSGHGDRVELSPEQVTEVTPSIAAQGIVQSSGGQDERRQLHQTVDREAQGRRGRGHLQGQDHDG
ncbi:IS66 family insertion sequence element accessory protein TnpB [Halomonas sp. YLB-10]|uniref:IS66 family insertion sequence element accessory protein TnpB n=1 Tax=Halomonas sp. YLB-10 TaxID=2483111 RepID=UPI0039089D4F